MLEKVMDKDQCPIHYWTGGNVNAPWTIFLHGAGEDHRAFSPQIPALEDRYQILTMDLRGHGRSRPMGSFSVPLAVDDLIAVMDSEGIKEAALAGQSLGGNIAQEIAFHYPDRTACLVLTDCFCNTKRYACVRTMIMKRIAPLLLPLYPWRLAIALTATMSAVNPKVQSYLIESAMTMGKKDYNRVLRETFTCPHEEKGYHIGKPMLLICGEKDIGMIQYIDKRWAGEEPDCEYHIIQGAAHCANQDNPAAFNVLLTDFLNKRYPA